MHQRKISQEDLTSAIKEAKKALAVELDTDGAIKAHRAASDLYSRCVNLSFEVASGLNRDNVSELKRLVAKLKVKYERLGSYDQSGNWNLSLGYM